MKKETTIRIKKRSLPIEPKKLLEQMAQKAKDLVSKIPNIKKRSV